MKDHCQQSDIKEMLPRGRQLFVWIFLAAWAVAGLLFLLFYTWQVAFAETLYSQTISNTYYEDHQGLNPLQSLGKDLTGTIDEIKVKVDCRNQKSFGFHFGHNSFPPGPTNWNPTWLYTNNWQSCAGNVVEEITVSIPKTELDKNLYYFIVSAGSYDKAVRVYGSSANTWKTAVENCYLAGYGWSACGSLADFWFALNIAPLPYDFEFYYPTDLAILAADFSNWSFNVEVPESGLYAIRISYKRVGGEFLSDRMEANLVAETGYILAPHKGALLGIGDWYAKAWLERYWPEEQEWEIILPSEREITFSITGILAPGEPETGDPFDIGICEDPEFTWIEKALCVVNIRVLRALFVPTPESLNRFTTLKDTIMNKPPIGYFYAVKDAFSGLSGQPPAFDLSIAGEEALEPIFKPLRAGFGFILWLFFGVWAVKRISHLEL